jgi:hypothetical protein
VAPALSPGSDLIRTRNSEATGTGHRRAWWRPRPRRRTW